MLAVQLYTGGVFNLSLSVPSAHALPATVTLDNNEMYVLAAAEGAGLPAAGETIRNDNTTASRICYLAGYQTVQSRSTSSWHSCHDNYNWYWSGSSWIRQWSCYHNSNLDYITCADPLPQCQNNIDDDNDGLMDLNDPGCSDPNDDDESDDHPSSGNCNDGIDNDGDGGTDYLFELSSSNNETETFGDGIPWHFHGFVETALHSRGESSPNDLLGHIGGMALVANNLTMTKVCNIFGYSSYTSFDNTAPDGRRIWTNGGDTMYNWTGSNWNRTDHQCSYRNPNGWSWIASVTCSSRMPQCSNGFDDDGDGDIDMNDSGCDNPNDDSEQFPHDPDCSGPDDDEHTPQCSDGIDNDGDGAIDDDDFSCSNSDDDDESDPESACQDGSDNDNDGQTDYPRDPGCEDNQDDSERDPNGNECDNGIDDDSDGDIDYPYDTGCEDAFDDTEQNPQCSDDIDNDGDGQADYPRDPGCSSEDDDDETTGLECDDGVDNDGDGEIDHPDDPGCRDVHDDDEREAGGPECDNGTDDDNDGETDYPDDPGCSGPADDSERDANGPDCDNGRDDDRDTYTDYPDDPGCYGPRDIDETDPNGPECDNGLDDDSDGEIDFPDDPECTDRADDTEGVNADLEFVSLTGPPSGFKDDVLLYYAEVANLGPDTAETVVISIPLPLGVDFDRGSSDIECVENGPNVLCNNFDLDNGRSRRFAIGLKVTEDIYCNLTLNLSATVSSSSTDPVSGNNSDSTSTDISCHALAACEDGLDNDGDGLEDYPRDPGCRSFTDDSDRDPNGPECDNGIDDDLDGQSDYPNDPECSDLSDDREAPDLGPPPTCNGRTATVYVDSATNTIVGGPYDGNPYMGTLRGTDDDDVMVGTDGRDFIYGRDGDDLICALGGNDNVDGDDDEDTIFGGAGNDNLDGEGDVDTIFGEGGDDTIEGGYGDDFICGGEGNDTLEGEAGNDQISGGDGTNDNLDGGTDSDICRGENVVNCEDTSSPIAVCGDTRPISQCSDGIDNDSDGATDLADFSCQGDPNNNDETNPLSQCQDGQDNDSDGYIDWPSDPSCSSAQDNTEDTWDPGNTECSDGIDNDSDGYTDWPNDPGCTDLQDDSEGKTSDLEVTKSNPGTVYRGTTVSYILTAINHGPDTATNVVVADLIPSGLTFNSLASDNDCVEQGGSVLCNNLQLVNGSSHSYTVVFDVSDTYICGGQIENTAAISTSATDPVSSNNQATVYTNVDCYECNDGVDNDLDGASDFGNDFSCSSLTDDDESSPLSQCQDGQDNDLDGNTDWPNDPGCTDLQDDSEGKTSDLEVTKSNPSTVYRGTTVSYTLEAINHGPDTATNVVVADLIPSGLTFNSLASDNDCVEQGGSVLCNNLQLASGGSHSYTVVFNVPSNYTCGGQIENTAAISTSATDPVSSNNQATVYTNVDCYECNDGVDNDSDGYTDWPNDPSCTSDQDDTEAPWDPGNTECSDGQDNDSDGFIDWPNDPSCTSLQDDTEDTWDPGNTECSDGADNDLDGASDYGNDFSCSSLQDDDETNPPSQCQDGQDNDSDGFIDLNDPGCSSNQDNDEYNIFSSDVEIIKSGVAQIARGGTILYTITVTNNGPDPALNIVVADDIPAGLTFNSLLSDNECVPHGNRILCDNLLVLNNGAHRTYFVAFDVDPNYTCYGTIENYASVSLSSTDPDSNNNTVGPISTTVTCTECNDGLDNDGDGATDHPDDFACSSPSDDDEDDVLAECQDGQDNDLDGQTDWPNDPDCTSSQDDDETGPITGADLEIIKSGPPIANAGGQITYTLTIRNYGPDTATNVVAADLIPAGLTFNSGASDQDCVVDPQGVDVLCNNLTLNSGASDSYDIVFDIDPNYTCGGTIDNSASVSASSTDPDPNNNQSGPISTTVQCPVNDADLYMGMSGPLTLTRNDTTITYTLTVTNNGPDQADNVEITNPIPIITASDGTFSFNDSIFNKVGDLLIPKAYAAPVSQPLVYLPGSSNPACSQVGGNIVCDAGNISNGSTATFVIVFQLPGFNNIPPAATITVSNSASAAGTSNDPNGANNSSSLLTSILFPTALSDLEIVKSGPPTANAGGQITYTLDITNHGPDTATNVVAADTIPAGLTFNQGASDQDCTQQGTDVLCNNLTLNSGASESYDIVFDIDPNYTCGGTIDNSASVSASSTDPDPNNNQSGPVTTTVNCPLPQADLEIIKAVQVQSVYRGGIVAFTLDVTNNGPDTATNVVAADPIPSGLTFNSGLSDPDCVLDLQGIDVLCNNTSLANGATRSYTVVFDIDNAYTCAGTITNTASVSTSATDPDPNNNQSQVQKIVDCYECNDGVDNDLDGATDWPNDFSCSSDTDNDESSPLAQCQDGIDNDNDFLTDYPNDPGCTSYQDDNEFHQLTSDLEIIKSGVPTIPRGNTLLYTLTVTNHGPELAQNIVVGDLVPAGLTFNPGLSDNDCVLDNNIKVLCDNLQLTNGSSRTYHVAFDIDPNYTCYDPIYNTATVSTSSTDPDSSNNTSGPITTTVTCTECDDGIDNDLDGATDYPDDFACSSPADDDEGDVLAQCQDGQDNDLDGQTDWPNDPDCTSNQDDDESGPITGADLMIVKSGPPTANAGGQITYTLDVTNNGPDTAMNVVASDTIPAGLTFNLSASDQDCTVQGSDVLCDNLTLNSGATDSYDIVFDIDPNYTCGGTIDNSASVSGSSTDPDPNNNQSGPVTTTVQCVTPESDLSISKSGPPTVNAGGQITYTLIVTNNGPDTATNVVAADTIPSGLTFNSGASDQDCIVDPQGVDVLCNNLTLISGDTESYDIVFDIDPNYTCGGTIDNSASVSTSSTDPNPNNNQSTVVTTTVNCPQDTSDLVLVKSGPATIQPGTQVTYTLSVTNLGPDTATNLEVEDIIPAFMTFNAGASDQRCQLDTQTANRVVCTEASLGLTTEQFDIVVDIDQGATCGLTLTNNSNATSSSFDPDDSNNSNQYVDSTVDCGPTGPDMSVDKSGPSTTQHNQTVVYDLEVTNNGPGNANGVMVSDVVPSGLVFNAGLSTQSCGLVGGSVVCPVPTLADGSTYTVQIAMDVSQQAPCNQNIINTGTVSSAIEGPDGDPSNNDSVFLTQIQCIPTDADVEITKIGSSPTVQPGGIVTYSLTVTNNGPEEATNVFAADPIPTGLTFNSLASDPDCIEQGADIICNNLLSMPSGSSHTYTVSFDVPQSAVCDSVIDNTATVSTSSTDPNPVNNTSQTVQTTVQCSQTGNADLNLTKSGPASISKGAVVVYDLAVTNLGPDTATNVSVIDYVPAGLIFNQAGSSQECVLQPSQTEVVCTTGSDLIVNDTAIFSVAFSVPGSTVTCDSWINNIANASADQADPNGLNNIATAQTQIGCPGYSVTKDANQTIAIPGSLLSYTIGVTNESQTFDAIEFTVIDILPPDVTYVGSSNGGVYDAISHRVTWIINLLAPQATLDLIVDVTVNQDATGDLINTAGVAGTSYNAQSIIPVLGSSEADLAIDKYCPYTVQNGGIMECIIWAYNNGPDTAEDVVIADTIPAGLTFNTTHSDNRCSQQGNDILCDLGSMQYLDSDGVSIYFDVPSGATCNSTITNFATVSTASTDPDSTNNRSQDTSTVVQCGTPTFTVEKTDNLTSAAPGDIITYEVTITNTSSILIPIMWATDILPQEVSFVNATNNGFYDSQMHSVDWSNLVLNPSSSITLEIIAQVNFGVPNATPIANFIFVGTHEPGAITAYDQTTILTQSEADVAISKSGPSTVQQGSTLTYTLTATNANGPDAAQDVMITDAIPSGLTFNSSQSTNGCTVQGTDVICSLGQLLVGGNSTVNLAFDVPGTATCGSTISNTASVSTSTTDPNTSNNTSSTVQTTVECGPSPTYSITKTDGVTEVQPGSTLTYSIVVTNTSTVNATNVPVSDSLPTNVTYITSSSSGIHNNGIVSWTIPSLGASESNTLTVTVRVDSSAADGTVLTNNAFVNGLQAQDTTTVRAQTQQDDMTITLSDSKDPVEPCDTFTYTVRVTNLTTSAISGKTVTLALDNDVDYVSSSDSGTHSNGTVTWSNVSIPASSTETLTANVKADCSAEDDDILRSTANVDDLSASEDTRVDDDDEDEEDITVAITDDRPDPVEIGEILTYNIRVCNESDSDIETDVEAELDEDVSFLSASDGGDDGRDDEVKWNDLDIDDDKCETLVLRVRVRNSAQPGGTLKLEVRAGDSDDEERTRVVGDIPPGPPPGPVPGEPAVLSVDKTADRREVQPGSLVTYSITIRNTSPYLAEDVLVNDSFAAGSFTVEDTAGGQVTSNGIKWTIPGLSPNAMRVLRYRVRINESMRHGQSISNTVTVTSPDTAGPSSDVETVNVIEYLPQTGVSGFIAALTGNSDGYIGAYEPTLKTPDGTPVNSTLPIIILYNMIAIGLGGGVMMGRRLFF